jgi:uncharacterized protein YkwD
VRGQNSRRALAFLNSIGTAAPLGGKVRRLVFIAMLGASLANAVPAAAATSGATSPTSQEAAVLRAVNDFRSAYRLGGLRWNATLAAIARRHSQEMAGSGTLAHDASLPSRVEDWTMLGENVGVGPDVYSIEDEFENSADHRRNLLSRTVDVGIGVIADGDWIWVTQVFVRYE